MDYQARAKELNSQQVQRFYESKKTVTEFFNDPYERQIKANIYFYETRTPAVFR